MGSSTASKGLLERFQAVRNCSVQLIAPLNPEDLCLQGMADASPPKWHLGHTTWFFEEFLLKAPELPPFIPGYEPADPRWGFLFNSYYDAIGERHPRPERGLLSRPPIAEVLAWRGQVDRAIGQGIAQAQQDPGQPGAAAWLELVELGLQHEQQHQELLLMDLLDGFSRNPLEPAAYPAGAGGVDPEEAYQRGAAAAPAHPSWLEMAGGLVEIGHPGGSSGPGASPGAFHFDNEAPRHRVWLEPFAIAERLVSNGDFAAFIADGGYRGFVPIETLSMGRKDYDPATEVAKVLKGMREGIAALG